MSRKLVVKNTAWRLRPALAAVSAGVAFALAACQGMPPPTPAAQPAAAAQLVAIALPAPLPLQVSVTEAAARRDQGAFILDVREQAEWNEVHIPGATLIPLGTLADRVKEVPDDREIVVVCRSGNRSQAGRDILLQAGFTRVTSMAGGMNEWRAAGHPTVAGP